MNKLNRWKNKLLPLCLVFLFIFLSACSEQASDSFEEVEEEKSIDHYGIDTELLDVESEMTLELLGEEKVIPADLVVIDNKVKISFPSELESVHVSAHNEEDEILDVTINHSSYEEDSEYGSFILFLSIEETGVGTKRLAEIYHDQKPYDVDILAKHYPAIANNFDALTYSQDEEYHRYTFFKSLGGDVLLTLNWLTENEEASKQLESLLCSIAASIEYLN